MESLELQRMGLEPVPEHLMEQINGGIDPPSTRTIIIGDVIQMFSPVGAVAFWIGYFSNKK